MLLSGVAIDANVIVYGNDDRLIVSDLVNVHVENVLGHLQAERHMQELVPSLVGVNCGEV